MKGKIRTAKAAIICSIVLWCTPCFPQGKTHISIGTNPVGSLFSIVGSGLSDLIQKHTDLEVRVKPLAGPSAWIPMIETGEITFGVMNARDAEIASSGTLVYKDQTGGKGFQFLRLAMVGLQGQYGALVRADAIQTLADFKGKKVAAGYSAHFMALDTLQAALVNLGVRWEDLQPVMTATYTSGIEALKQNRVQICDGSAGAGIIKEANVTIGGGGCYIFPADTSPEGVKRLKNFSKSYYLSPADPALAGVQKPGQHLETLDVYLVTGSNVSDEIVYKVTKAVYENCADLLKIHPGFKTWKQERMFSQEASIPYHAGSMKLYSEKGAGK